MKTIHVYGIAVLLLVVIVLALGIHDRLRPMSTEYEVKTIAVLNTGDSVAQDRELNARLRGGWSVVQAFPDAGGTLYVLQRRKP